jgi:hypothetical protein
VNWSHCRVLVDGRTTDWYFRTKKWEEVARVLDYLLTERKTERAPKREKAEVPAD